MIGRTICREFTNPQAWLRSWAENPVAPMRQKLFVRISLLCVGLALACIGTIAAVVGRAPPKSADENFSELYSSVQIGTDPWERANAPIMSRSNEIRERDLEEIVSILREGKEYEVLQADQDAPDAHSWLYVREFLLRLTASKSLVWRKWEHPTDARKWFAAAVRSLGTCNFKIVCKVSVGF